MKLLVFTPCEKVILNREGGASLIEILSEGTPQIVGPVPERTDDAIVPKQWAIFAFWETAKEEWGKSFVQKTCIYWPNGKQLASIDLPFTAEHNKRTTSNVVNLPGFPIGQTGYIRIEVWIEADGEKVTDVGVCTILVNEPKIIPADQVKTMVPQ